MQKVEPGEMSLAINSSLAVCLVYRNSQDLESYSTFTEAYAQSVQQCEPQVDASATMLSLQ
jgi:hypothetical protein